MRWIAAVIVSLSIVVGVNLWMAWVATSGADAPDPSYAAAAR